MRTTLPSIKQLLVVSAHPDDESFGLGAVLDAFAATGTALRLLCFTRGEASTLGMDAADLAMLRTEELTAAAAVLGIEHVTLLDYPDGGLARIPLDELAARVEEAIAGADALLVFDEGGITGHPDHERATAAACAIAARRHLPVLAWTLPLAVAATLNEEFGAAFVGREEIALDYQLAVDRGRQREAISCHSSQSTHNPVLWRRLELMGDREYLRVLTGRRAVRDEGTGIPEEE